MSFNPSKPGDTDRFPASALDLRNNFGSINTSFSNNHIALNAASDLGKHTAMQLVEGAASATAVNEIGLYAADTGAQPDLFVRPQSNGTAQRLSGGGLTAAAYCTFNGATGALTDDSFNIATSVRTGVGLYNVTFTRSFANTNYIAVLFPIAVSGGAQTIKVISVTKVVAGCLWTIQNQANAATDVATMECLFFGILA